ncbi:hypothetical protein BDZ91DRAFT_726974 [Kalaharituber pfeilii]|nr:hypothetical protein BDZ91DRAFT_726974 [Kalaharituber pfeilii]
MQIKYRSGEFLGTLHKYRQSHTTYIYSTQNICGVAKTLGNSNAAISAFFLSGFLSATRSPGVSTSQIF